MTALWSLFKTDHTVQQNRGGHGKKVPCLILLLPDFSKKGHENVQSRVRRSRRGGFFRSSLSVPSSQLFPVCGERSICFLQCTSQVSCEKYFENTKHCMALNANGSPWSQRLITPGGSVHTDIKTYSPQTCRRRSCCPSHHLVTLFSVPAASPAQFFPLLFNAKPR